MTEPKLRWTEDSHYTDVFQCWFLAHPQVQALQQEYMTISRADGDRPLTTPRDALLRVIHRHEAESKYREDYARLQGQLRVVFDREVADLRERFEACKFPAV